MASSSFVSGGLVLRTLSWEHVDRMPSAGEGVSLLDNCSIDQDTVKKAHDFVLSHYDRICDRDRSDSSFHFYGAKHCIVFSHSDFPGLVIKVMSQSQAIDSKRSIDRARALFDSEKFQYCHAPAAEMVDLSGYEDQTLLVMEKAAGNTDEYAAKEEMEKEFERIDQDPQMEKKWRRMTFEVAQATAKLGYWDSQRKNLIWDSQKGWSFIDFEDVEPTLDHIETGLNRLVEIFPHQFADVIYDVAEESRVNLAIPREDAKSQRFKQFCFSRELSQRNEQKGLPRFIDIDRWPIGSWERKIVEEFDGNRSGRQNFSPEQTELYWQPFCNEIDYSNFLFAKMFQKFSSLKREAGAIAQSTGASEILDKRRAFEEALGNLQSQGVVYTWTSEGNDPWLVGYQIYF